MQALKNALKATLASPPAWRCTAPLRKPCALVLAYHRIGRPGDELNHVDVEQFGRQMRWIKRHCRPIAPEALNEAADPRDRRPRVLITFDDGYRDYYELAYPILHDLRIPAVNFISTDYVDTGRMFWWDIVDIAGRRSARKQVTLPWAPGRTWEVGDASRLTLVRTCKDVIASAPDADRDRLVADVCAMFDVDPATLDTGRQVMTWDQIRASTELTHYGGHTHTHVRVSRVDADLLEREIRICRDRIRTETCVAPTLFAYPIGDSSEAALRVLPRFGFDTAFTMHNGYADAPLDRLNVPRFAGPKTVGRLAWLATGRARPGTNVRCAPTSARRET